MKDFYYYLVHNSEKSESTWNLINVVQDVLWNSEYNNLSLESEIKRCKIQLVNKNTARKQLGENVYLDSN